MAHAIKRERIEMRVDADIKQLAERASAALGCASLTEFMTRLIRENAPMILEHETTIRLASDRFDQFVAACNDTERTPSKKIMDAARRLDAEGL
jgi:uncharacterized protein (DUF1778 family)